MALALEILLLVGVIGWVSRHVTRHRSYRESCRLRLRAARTAGFSTIA